MMDPDIFMDELVFCYTVDLPIVEDGTSTNVAYVLVTHGE